MYRKDETREDFLQRIPQTETIMEQINVLGGLVSQQLAHCPTDTPHASRSLRLFRLHAALKLTHAMAGDVLAELQGELGIDAPLPPDIEALRDGPHPH